MSCLCLLQLVINFGPHPSSSSIKVSRVLIKIIIWIIRNAKSISWSVVDPIPNVQKTTSE